MSNRSLTSLLLILLVTACQPSPEERYGRAQEYFAQSDYRATVLELKNALQQRPDYPQARVLLGLASYQVADFASAQSEFERALSLGMDEPEVWEYLGKTLFARGDTRGIIERIVPNLPPASANESQLVLLGDAYLALDNISEAQNHYARALILNESAPGALIGQAVIASKGGDDALAEDYLQQALAAHPDSEVVWRAQGNYLRSNYEFMRAADAYEKALSLESGATPFAERLMTRVNLVSALLDSRQVDMARARFEVVRQEFPSHPVIRFLAGRLAFASGDYDVAQRELREYVSQYPNDLRGYALLGAVSFSQNHLRQAEAYLAQAVSNNVGGDATARLLAETRLRLNRPGEALGILSNIEGSSTTDAAMLTMHGRAQLGLGNTAAAIDYFEAGVAAVDRSAAVNLALAAGFFAVGENDRAIELLEQMPEQADARFRREALLMAAHMRENRRSEAVSIANDLIAANPDDSVAFATVGVLMQAIGDTDSARRHLTRSIELDSRNKPAVFSLSRLELMAGNRDAARSLLLNILDIDPAFMPALVTLVGIFQADGRLADMKPLLQAAIDSDATLLAPHLLYIRVAMMNNSSEDALRGIRRARDEFPDEVRLVHAEGLVFLQEGKVESALINLRRAANTDRQSAEFQFDHASASLTHNDPRSAETAILRYRDLRPDDSRGLVLHVASLVQMGRYQDAKTEIAGFPGQEEQQPNLLVLLGDVELASGDLEAAVRRYESAGNLSWTRDIALRLSRVYRAIDADRAADPLARWLDEHPEDAQVRRLYAQILEAQGDNQAATAEYERAAGTLEDDPVVLNNLAWQYALAGRPEAVELAERAHVLAPNDANITDTLGWILLSEGELERALMLLRTAAAQSPDNPDIQFHFAAALAKSGEPDEAGVIINRLLNKHDAFASRKDAEELANSL